MDHWSDTYNKDKESNGGRIAFGGLDKIMLKRARRHGFKRREDS